MHSATALPVASSIIRLTLLERDTILASDHHHLKIDERTPQLRVGSAFSCGFTGVCQAAV
ncbi:hypothetical protein J2T09_005068 [Neorhizobium huautlense]|uniref:Uncharacterized protein n=1 Tax=Neorhizobium huautlense TaxID=67774 RepID=A0ABT9Q0P4_9HYPH|nr:hypothetical protein [Neorhizobium huautlense]MDP9840284.1 hypothetical protein [Neorhizobium huautlense]